MKNTSKQIILIVIIFSLLILGIFWQFFFKNLILFPGNYMLAWYEPWKTDHIVNGVIQIAHKPIASDIFRQIYPFKILAIETMRTFHWPLWNPYNGAGMPLLATSNIGLLDPLNALFFVFSTPVAWTLYTILPCLFIGYATYLFSRKLGLGLVASLFTGISFLFSGAIVVRIPYGIFGIAIAMLPFILYLLEDYFQNQKTKRIFILPFAIFLIIITTSPQISFFIFASIICYMIFRAMQEKKTFLFPMIFIGIGIALSAVQIVPTIELYLQANINSQTSTFIFDRFLLPPQHILSLFIPNFFGSDATYNYWGSGDYIESTMYLGLIPCLFGLIGSVIKPKQIPDIRKFLFGIILLSFLISFNWIGSHLLILSHLPIFSTDIPSRIFILSTFALVILGGYGIQAYVEHKEDTMIKNISIVYIFLATIVFIGIFLLHKTHFPCTNPVIKTCGAIAFRNSLLEYGGFFIFFITSIVLLKIKRNTSYILALGIVIIATLGLFNTYKFLPFSPQGNIMPKNGLISYLHEHASDGRVFGFGQANIATDFATYYHWYDPNYYHPLYIKRYGELVQYGNSGTALSRSDVEIVKDVYIDKLKQEQRQRLLDILGVNSLLYKISERKPLSTDTVLWQDKNWYITRNYSAMPRIRIASNVEVIQDKQLILKQLFNPLFNPAKTVILEEKPNLTLNIKPGFAYATDYSENQIDIFTYTTANSVLILDDNYYPGWKAYIDGKETHIFRANYTFRAIALPSGNHAVQFIYKPFSFKLGLLITHAGLLAYLIIIYVKYKKKIS